MIALRQPRARIGVLSVHLDGKPCRVGCDFCYLAARSAFDAPLDLDWIEGLLARVDYDEVAVALSEPIAPVLPALERIAGVVHRRGRRLTVTTTAAALRSHPQAIMLATRVNLSIDPFKGSTDPAVIDRVAASVRSDRREVILIASLVDPSFAERLIDGLLAELVALPTVDGVALNALKPPPRWCDRAFWLRACARLAPLLERHLDRRLFLDCYVAARILGVGDCPGRADLSPGRQFRSCVYQASPDAAAIDAGDLAVQLARFVAPSTCPFEIL